MRSQLRWRGCRTDTQAQGRRCERAARRALRCRCHRAVAVVVVAVPRCPAAGSPVAPAGRGVVAAVVVGSLPAAAVLVAVAVRVVGRVALEAPKLPEVRLAVVAVVVGANLGVEVWV